MSQLKTADTTAIAPVDKIQAIKSLEQEIVELNKLKDKISIKMDKVKDELEQSKLGILEGMNKHGIKSISGDNYKITIRKAPEVLKVTDESKITDQGLWKIKRELDKTLIKARLKAGGKVSGCELGEGKQSVLIKFG
jgi:hypothetical protein